MAKSAVVSFTRSFGQKGRQGPWKKDGVKAWALCPWFADTQLVNDIADVKAIERKMKYRILTVKEVRASQHDEVEPNLKKIPHGTH